MEKRVEPKQKTIEVSKIVYYVSCPLCKKEIQGASVNQFHVNMSRHLKSCNGGGE